MSSDLYLAESKIVIDWQDSQAESIFAVAQQCWTLWFGKPRASCSTRLDSGVPRKRLDGSEASFAAKRHKHMHEIETVLPSMVRASTESQGMPILMDAEKEKIEKEINFQKSKHMRSQLEAYLDGVLLENEIPEGLREAAVSFRQKQTANSDQRKANEARLISVMTPQPPDVNFASAKLFLQDPVWAQKLPRTLSFVADVWRADVWVVTDPANPDLAVIWHAALKGACGEFGLCVHQRCSWHIIYLWGCCPNKEKCLCGSGLCKSVSGGGVSCQASHKHASFKMETFGFMARICSQH